MGLQLGVWEFGSLKVCGGAALVRFDNEGVRGLRVFKMRGSWAKSGWDRRGEVLSGAKKRQRSKGLTLKWLMKRAGRSERMHDIADLRCAMMFVAKNEEANDRVWPLASESGLN